MQGRGEARSQLQELPGPLAGLIESQDCLEMRPRPLSLWGDQGASQSRCDHWYMPILAQHDHTA